MQRMIEYGQKEMAWQLFKNMNRQALVEGAAGSLSENADAHPREGKSRAALSGTFLQAWSNSEQLRVWYQHFLGIRPDMMNKTIYVEPRLPEEITDLETSMMVGNGKVCISYHDGEFACRLDNLPGVRLVVKMESASKIERDKTNPIFRNIDFCRPQPLDHYPCFDVRHDPPLTY